jgi:hypothetical protein
MIPKRLLLKLIALTALAFGCLYASPTRAQGGDEGFVPEACAMGCVLFDDGTPGCANYDGRTGKNCSMFVFQGENYCVQWGC